MKKVKTYDLIYKNHLVNEQSNHGKEIKFQFVDDDFETPILEIIYVEKSPLN